MYVSLSLPLIFLVLVDLDSSFVLYGVCTLAFVDVVDVVNVSGQL